MKLFGYIELPKKLTDIELSQILDQYQNGNKKAKEILINQSLCIIEEVIIDNFSSYPDKEELVGVASEFLVDKINYLDFKNINGFCQYIYNKTLIELNDYVILENNHLKSLIEKKTYDVEEAYLEREFMEELWRLLDTLKERDRQILELYFGYRKTQKEISDIVGIGKTQVSRIIKKSLIMIRRGLNKYNNCTTLIDDYYLLSPKSRATFIKNLVLVENMPIERISEELNIEKRTVRLLLRNTCYSNKK